VGQGSSQVQGGRFSTSTPLALAFSIHRRGDVPMGLLPGIDLASNLTNTRDDLVVCIHPNPDPHHPSDYAWVMEWLETLIAEIVGQDQWLAQSLTKTIHSPLKD
jgi:hypothetical protein